MDLADASLLRIAAQTEVTEILTIDLRGFFGRGLALAAVIVS